MFKGSCFCGQISYEIEGDLSDFGYCHCRSCRKASAHAKAHTLSVTKVPGKKLMIVFRNSTNGRDATC